MRTDKDAARPQRDDAVEQSTPEAARRRSVLEKAKARANAPRPGPLRDTPRFDEVQAAGKTMRPAPGHDTPPPTLSRGTADALAAMAEANANRTAAPAADVQDPAPRTVPDGPLDREAISELLGVDLLVASEIYSIAYPSRDDDVPLKRRIEMRLQPIDIGEFLMNGSVTQVVPLIQPSESVRKGLNITFQTVTDAVEAVVDRLLSVEAAKIRKERDGDTFIDVEMSQREYVRRQNEYAIAVHVSAYGEAKWPPLLNGSGVVDEGAIQQRMAKVRQIPSPVFGMMVDNLGWFLVRVQRTLEVAVLGNG